MRRKSAVSPFSWLRFEPLEWELRRDVDPAPVPGREASLAFENRLIEARVALSEVTCSSVYVDNVNAVGCLLPVSLYTCTLVQLGVWIQGDIYRGQPANPNFIPHPGGQILQ